MSESETILRIAAKGDGVTASGRHVAGAAPGDMVAADGAITKGAHHIEPVCRHFGKCGGCQLQHLDEETLAAFVRDRVVNTALGQELVLPEVGAAIMSPPASRRRVSLRIINGGGRALLGYNETGSHRLVEIRECPILRPELLAVAEQFRAYFSKVKGKFSYNIELSLTDQGVDCLIAGFAPQGLTETEDLLDLCRDLKLARLTLDQGYGPEPFWEPEPATVSFGDIAAALPPGAFLQPTLEGEQALVGAAREWLEGCVNVADLFAGIGTFALSLADGRKVLAAEADRAAILACRSAGTRAGLQLEVSHRDLFRNPLRAAELAGFDGVVLDPPRAGARSQVEQLAASGVGRVVYISCNPSSWARDAKVLCEAGYELVQLRPVGQFRWSTHVELASLFVKNCG